MNKHLGLFLIISACSLFSFESWALDCQWWQTKVKAATISQHQREGHNVSKHPRQEHCRERWLGADRYINQFKNDPIPGWSNKGETFKNWDRGEMQKVLEVLPPIYPNEHKLNAILSDAQTNPFTKEILQQVN